MSYKTVPQECPTGVSHKECPTRALRKSECPTRECSARVSYKGVPQQCPPRMSDKVSQKMSDKSVTQECPSRVADESVLQECPTRVPCKSLPRPQECPVLQEYLTRVSYKRAPTRVSHKSGPQKRQLVSQMSCGKQLLGAVASRQATW